MRMVQEKIYRLVGMGCVGVVCAMSLILGTRFASAAESGVPWECSGFSAEAQSRCLQTFAELQQEKIAKLEKELESQRQTVQSLKQQVARQASSTAELERHLKNNRSRWYGSRFVPVYPSVSLGLRFGRDRFWRGSLWYGTPRYFGPRWYGHGPRRWHRH